MGELLELGFTFIGLVLSSPIANTEQCIKILLASLIILGAMSLTFYILQLNESKVISRYVNYVFWEPEYSPLVYKSFDTKLSIIDTLSLVCFYIGELSFIVLMIMGSALFATVVLCRI